MQPVAAQPAQPEGLAEALAALRRDQRPVVLMMKPLTLYALLEVMRLSLTFHQDHHVEQLVRRFAERLGTDLPTDDPRSPGAYHAALNRLDARHGETLGVQTSRLEAWRIIEAVQRCAQQPEWPKLAAVGVAAEHSARLIQPLIAPTGPLAQAAEQGWRTGPVAAEPPDRCIHCGCALGYTYVVGSTRALRPGDLILCHECHGVARLGPDGHLVTAGDLSPVEQAVMDGARGVLSEKEGRARA